MKCVCNDIQTGDQGQRFEVRATDADGKDICIGWADNPEHLVKGVDLHPSMHSPRIIERQKRRS